MDKRLFSSRRQSRVIASLGLAFTFSVQFFTSIQAQDREVIIPNSIGPTDSQPSPSDTSQPSNPSAIANSAAANASAKTDDKKTDDKQPVAASAKEPFARDIQNIALQAQKQLNVNTLPKLDVARQQLISALDNLERYLQTNPSSREAWRSFLRLDAMRSEAEKEKPSVTSLTDLEMAMRQNYLGLEYQPYTKVRDCLADFKLALRWGANPKQSLELLDTRLARLVETLNEPIADADLNEAVSVVALYLEQSNQAPVSLAAFCSKYSQPNIQAQVSESFITRLLARPVAQPSAVNECLLGTTVVGVASLNGAVTAYLMPSQNGISLCLNLNANLTTNSTGYNRGVVLRSTGASPIHAAKQINVTPQGIYSSPASVATNLQTQINSIEHRSRIVRRIAKRKVAESQPQAKVIAEGRLQSRVSTQFDQQVEGQLSQSRSQLASFQQRAQSRPELARIGIPKPTYSFNSSASAVHALATERATSQLSAPRASPLPQSSDAQVFIDAHESVVMNAIDIFLSGRTIRNSELDELVTQFGAKVTPELQAEADSEPWSITFASIHPILIEMNDGLVKITLRISKMTRGEQTLNQDTVVSATYRPSIANGYLRLDREGEMGINFIGRGGLGSVSLKPFIKGKFEKTFKPVLVNAPVNLPTPNNPAFPRLQVSNLIVDNGWAQISLR